MSDDNLAVAFGVSVMIGFMYVITHPDLEQKPAEMAGQGRVPSQVQEEKNEPEIEPDIQPEIEPTPVAIDWLTDPEEAMKLAQERDLPFLVHFIGENCSQCERQKQQLWPDPMLASLVMESTIPVVLDADRYKGWAMQFGVEELPETRLYWPQGDGAWSLPRTTDPLEMASRLKACLMSGPPTPE